MPPSTKAASSAEASTMADFRDGALAACVSSSADAQPAGGTRLCPAPPGRHPALGWPVEAAAAAAGVSPPAAGEEAECWAWPAGPDPPRLPLAQLGRELGSLGSSCSSGKGQASPSGQRKRASPPSWAAICTPRAALPPVTASHPRAAERDLSRNAPLYIAVLPRKRECAPRAGDRLPAGLLAVRERAASSSLSATAPA